MTGLVSQSADPFGISADTACSEHLMHAPGSGWRAMHTTPAPTPAPLLPASSQLVAAAASKPQPCAPAPKHPHHAHTLLPGMQASASPSTLIWASSTTPPPVSTVSGLLHCLLDCSLQCRPTDEQSGRGFALCLACHHGACNNHTGISLV